MTTSEDIRARLAGYSPALAQEAEAAGDHDKNKKFAPPWYELKHFRATLSLTGVYPNKNGIDGVVFALENAEIYEGATVAGNEQIHVPLPRQAPGYPTDELNLMVESANAIDPAIQNVADMDGLDIELELDYAEHPWMKERGKDGNDILVGGVPLPKRCWYYKTIAIFNTKSAPAPEVPDPENVRKLAEWCVGKTAAECNKKELLKATSAQVLGITDGPLQKLIMNDTFLQAGVSGLALDEIGKFVLG